MRKVLLSSVLCVLPLIADAALVNGGLVVSWGRDAYNQVSNTPTAEKFIDLALSAPGGFKTIAAGNYSSSALVPVPAAVWLFGSGLGLLGWFRRRAT
jgi:hypothetical protein